MHSINLLLTYLHVAFSALTLLAVRQEGHPKCKKWGDGGGGHFLVRMEWRPPGRSVCLPLLAFPSTIKSRSSLLAPAHLGRPGKRAVKWLWWLLTCFYRPDAFLLAHFYAQLTVSKH